jgi:hypothetical protein
MLAEQIGVLEKAAAAGQGDQKAELDALKLIAQGIDAKEIKPEAFDRISLSSFDAVLGEIVARREYELFARISELSLGHDQRRLLNKAMHRLRSAGIEIKEKIEERKVIFSSQVTAEWSMATPVMLLSGEQLVYYFISGTGGSNFLVIHLDPVDGIREFTPLKLKESKARAIAQKSAISSEIPVPVEVITKEHFLWLVGNARAKSKNSQEKVKLDQTFGKLRLSLPETPETHPVLSLVDIEKLSGNSSLIFESERLLDHPYFSNWAFDPLSIKSCGEEIDQAAHSPLQLSESQLDERMESIFEKWAVKAVAESKDRIQYGLRENAFLMKMRKQDELAEIALAMSLELEDDEGVLPNFFKKLMIRSFPEAWKKLGEKPNPLIIS